MLEIRRTCACLGFFTIIVYQCMLTVGISFDEYVTLSGNQKQALDNFKARVVPNIKEDYMKKDIYLIRWLRNANFDISRAENALYTNLKKRENLRMDTIHEEDWSEFENEFPYWVDGVDREGRPLILLPMDDWDLRKAALSGRTPKLNRYFEKALDDINLKIRDLQEQEKNVTQCQIVVKVGRINVGQQINPASFPFWIAGATAYESGYSGLADKIILVDSPAIFDIALQVMRPVMSPQTRNALTAIGKNPNEAKRLFDIIDPNELPISYGGTRDYN